MKSLHQAADRIGFDKTGLHATTPLDKTSVKGKYMPESI